MVPQRYRLWYRLGTTAALTGPQIDPLLRCPDNRGTASAIKMASAGVVLIHGSLYETGRVTDGATRSRSGGVVDGSGSLNADGEGQAPQ